ncbi:MAG TPA: redoxin domain-containing protein [Terriglobales bacterium]|nr:redoxin domain-containing protein [Terriglobales bacterium]
MVRRVVAGLVLVVLLGWAVLVAAVSWAMHQSPEQFGRFMAKMPGPAYLVLPFETLWMRARQGALRVGDEAPDFNLATVDKSARVRLSDLRGKPVVLVFGSYT